MKPKKASREWNGRGLCRRPSVGQGPSWRCPACAAIVAAHLDTCPSCGVVDDFRFGRFNEHKPMHRREAESLQMEMD